MIKNKLPILLIIAGIIDQSTELLTELLTQLNLPLYFATILRIIVVILGGIKLYYAQPD